MTYSLMSDKNGIFIVNIIHPKYRNQNNRSYPWYAGVQFADGSSTCVLDIKEVSDFNGKIILIS